MAQIPFTVSLNLLAITNDHDNYDYMRSKPKTGKWALPIDFISKRIAYHLPKGKLILDDTLFNMAAGIQIKFHQDTMFIKIQYFEENIEYNIETFSCFPLSET